MVSLVSILLELFDFVTGVDVLNEVSISDGADGGQFFQQYPIRIDDISL